MLYSIVQTVIGLSITASIMILVVLILKCICKLRWGNIKKSAFVFMWVLIFCRLVVPFSGDTWLADFAVVNPAVEVYQAVVSDRFTPENQAITDPVTFFEEKENETHVTVNGAPISTGIQSKTSLRNLQGREGFVTSFFLILWVAVSFSRFSYLVIGYFAMIHKVKKIPNFSYDGLEALVDRVGLKNRVCLKIGEEEFGPAVYGVFKPTIVISKGSISNIEEILLHELMHVKSKDNLKKLFCEAVFCVHWFNPMVWFARNQIHKDIELSCDEKVIAIIGYENRSLYANAILNFATNRVGFGRTSFASFGKNPVLGRMKNILRLKNKSFQVPIICMAVVLFVMTGAVSGPIHQLSNQLLSYALQPNFSNIKLTEKENETIIDYSVEGELLYYIASDTLAPEQLTAGYKIGVYDQKSGLNQSLLRGQEKAVPNSFHYANEKIYYVLQSLDLEKPTTSIMEYNLISNTSKELWVSQKSALEDVRITGNDAYLSWHEIFLNDAGVMEDHVLVWDLKLGKIVHDFMANGNQNYLNILDGFVTYQRENTLTGKTEIVRQPIENGEALVIENQLEDMPYSAYGNEDFMVYKEAYQPGAEIVVYEVKTGTWYSLWDALKSQLQDKGKKISMQQLKQYEEGVWGINLIKNTLLLTGESHEILEINLTNLEITCIGGSETINAGFYHTKIGENMVSSMQYYYDDAGETWNRLFYGKIIEK